MEGYLLRHSGLEGAFHLVFGRVAAYEVRDFCMKDLGDIEGLRRTDNNNIVGVPSPNPGYLSGHHL